MAALCDYKRDEIRQRTPWPIIPTRITMPTITIMRTMARHLAAKNGTRSESALSC